MEIKAELVEKAGSKMVECPGDAEPELLQCKEALVSCTLLVPTPSLDYFVSLSSGTA